MIEYNDYDNLTFAEKSAEFFENISWKDVWIACRLDLIGSEDDILWIKPEYLSGHGELTKLHYYYINNECLLDPMSLSEYDMTWFSDTVRWDYLYNILVGTPLEVLTTDEIYDYLGEYLSQ